MGKNEPETSPQIHVVIIDFLALVKKIPSKKLEPFVKTFDDVDLPWHLYSPKVSTFVMRYTMYSILTERMVSRIQRGEEEESQIVVLDMISLNQNVPVVLEYSWLSSMSKTVLQAFFVEWLTTNYKDSKPLYLGISPQAWLVSAGCASPFPRLNCTHKEADDRMMFHVQDILSHWSGPTSMTRSLGDTDVFVCVLYCITVSWKDLGLQELWLICNSGMRRSKLPVHDICTALEDNLTRCLPALHALTGCDTTNNISTKLAALNERYPQNFISDPQL